VTDLRVGAGAGPRFRLLPIRVMSNSFSLERRSLEKWGSPYLHNSSDTPTVGFDGKASGSLGLPAGGNVAISDGAMSRTGPEVESKFGNDTVTAQTTVDFNPESQLPPQIGIPTNVYVEGVAAIFAAWLSAKPICAPLGPIAVLVC